MDNKKKVYTTLSDGTRLEYDAILTFTDEHNHKDYIVYTDNTYDNDNKLRIYASIYDPLTYEFLGVPESQEEWNKIYDLLGKVLVEE